MIHLSFSMSQVWSSIPRHSSWIGSHTFTTIHGRLTMTRLS